MSLPELQVSDRTEIIHAVRRKDWHMTGADLSSLFLLVTGENWAENVRHNYWRELFNPLLEKLNSQPETLVELKLHCRYSHGVIDEKRVAKLIDNFSQIPTLRYRELKVQAKTKSPIGMMVRVSTRDLDKDKVSVCQMVILGTEISKLEPVLA